MQEALERDRAVLCLPPNAHPGDYGLAGPYAITVDGADLDEYVVWER